MNKATKCCRNREGEGIPRSSREGLLGKISQTKQHLGLRTQSLQQLREPPSEWNQMCPDPSAQLASSSHVSLAPARSTSIACPSRNSPKMLFCFVILAPCVEYLSYERLSLHSFYSNISYSQQSYFILTLLMRKSRLKEVKLQTQICLHSPLHPCLP